MWGVLLKMRPTRGRGIDASCDCAATGHAAVYLSGVCAETPLVLRRCGPGETGVVLSRYDGRTRTVVASHYDGKELNSLIDVAEQTVAAAVQVHGAILAGARAIAEGSAVAVELSKGGVHF